MQARQHRLHRSEMSLWVWIDFLTWGPFRLANQNCLGFARLKEVGFPRVSLKNADWWERFVLGQYGIAFSRGFELFMGILVFCASCLTLWKVGVGGECRQLHTQIPSWIRLAVREGWGRTRVEPGSNFTGIWTNKPWNETTGQQLRISKFYVTYGSLLTSHVLFKQRRKKAIKSTASLLIVHIFIWGCIWLCSGLAVVDG